MTPELSRVVALDRLPAAFAVEADPAECRALAARLGIPAVLALSCRFALRRIGDRVLAEGVLAAQVVQSCVVSLEPVEQAVHDTFAIRFVPAGTEADDGDPEAPDELPYEGARIDLGEAAAEQLALALDPYPRREDAVLDDAAAEASGGAFAALAGRGRPS